MGATAQDLGGARRSKSVLLERQDASGDEARQQRVQVAVGCCGGHVAKEVGLVDLVGVLDSCGHLVGSAERLSPRVAGADSVKVSARRAGQLEDATHGAVIGLDGNEMLRAVARMLAPVALVAKNRRLGGQLARRAVGIVSKAKESHA